MQFIIKFFLVFLPRDAYAQRGLCRGKMSVRRSVSYFYFISELWIYPKRVTGEHLNAATVSGANFLIMFHMGLSVVIYKCKIRQQYKQEHSESANSTEAVALSPSGEWAYNKIKCPICCSVAPWWVTIYRKNAYRPMLRKPKSWS